MSRFKSSTFLDYNSFSTLFTRLFKISAISLLRGAETGSWSHTASCTVGRGQLKCDGTRAETRFCLSAKRTSPFKLAGASVQSTTGSRGVRISGSNAGYTVFRGSVKGTGYPLHSSVSHSLPLPMRHRVPTHFNWSLPGTLWSGGKLVWNWTRTSSHCRDKQCMEI